MTRSAEQAEESTTGTTRVPGSLWLTAAVLSTGSVMAGLDTSLVNVGLDTISRSLGEPLASAQWISSGYLVALAAALPACGWFSRRLGAGRLWLWSLAAFTVASALCAIAPNVPTLIAARVLQGLAGGLLIPAGMTILGEAAGGARMGRVIAISSVPGILAPAFGPVVGALLIAGLSWPWLFLVNLPVGLAGLLAGLRWVPRGERGQAGRLDLVGLGLVSVGLPLLVFGISKAAETRTFTASSWLPVLAGVLTLALFVWRSLLTRTPLTDLRLFVNRVYAAAAAEIFLASAVLFGGLIVMPLYFQLQARQDIVDSGLLLMAFSLAAAATFPVGGWLTDRYSGGFVTVAGLLLSLASTVPMALLPADADLVTVVVLQIFRGVGMALSGSPGVSAALASVRRDQMADASTQVNTWSRVGGALGSAVFVVILASSMPAGAGEEAIAGAFRTTFWWLSAGTVLALAAAVWLTFRQRGTTGRG